MDKEKYANRVDELWNQLSIHMSNKFNTVNNSNEHYGIRGNDFPNSKESIVEFINNKIDLDLKKSGLFLRVYLQTKDQYPHWNESLDKLIDYYYDIFNRDDDDDDFKDLIKNDAANSFYTINPWVKPNENINNKNYDEIRGTDKILSILKNSKNLQFTLDKIELNYYLRLIMPEYKRDVEIEDLNRNFWVIGQALSLLYAYIFDENNPLPKLLSGILDEITQLWENMFYLWLTTSMLTEKFYQKQIKTLIYSTDFDFIKKIDTSSAQDMLENFWQEYGNILIDKYNDTVLVIIPEIKCNNYAKNYYSKAIYPGVIVYDNSQFNPDYWFSIIPFDKALIIDLKEKEIKLENLLGDDENE